MKIQQNKTEYYQNKLDIFYSTLNIISIVEKFKSICSFYCCNGMFKNRTGVVKEITKDEKGQIIIITTNNKKIPLLKIRLINEEG